MNNGSTAQSGWQKLIPHGRPAIISLIVVAIVAFFLGGLMMSDGNSAGPGDSNGPRASTESAESSKTTLWTCSMHPQIQLPKPGKCPICFMDLIPVETGGGGELDPNQIRMSATAVQLAKIQTTAVRRGFAERTIRMVGKLDYDETEVSYITAWVPGRLDKLFVDFTGATVSQGDHMVQIYSPELIAAQEELLQANRAVANLDKSGSAILISTAKETVISAREKLRLYGLSDQQIKEIEQGSAPMQHLTISAPVSGVVVHKDAKEGMYVSTGTRIYTIANLRKLWVMLEAYESDLPWLKLGQPLSFRSPSFPGERFDAVISFIDPTVNPKTRTVDVRAIVDNSDMRLKPEMFVSADVVSRLNVDGEVLAAEPNDQSSAGAPLLIPASAPLVTGKRAVVYVEVPSEEGVVFEGREIELGSKAGEFYVVKDGLQEGETIVTNGAFKIDSELQIQAKPSMMSPKEGAANAAPDHRGATSLSITAETPHEPYRAGTASPIDINEEAQVALTPVYEAYFKVQMALAKDDLELTSEAYDELIDVLAKVKMELFKNAAHTRWMKLSHNMNAAAESGKSAGSITKAREAFFNLSLAAIELHDTFGHAANASYYLTFCPMARDNAGAYWLQDVNVVWNSFYGAAMLRCGEIKEELKAGSKEAK